MYSNKSNKFSSNRYNSSKYSSGIFIILNSYYRLRVDYFSVEKLSIEE